MKYDGATQLCKFPCFVLLFSSSGSVVHTVTRERRGLPQTRPNSALFRLYPRLAYHLTREICPTANEKENPLFARPLISTMGEKKGRIDRIAGNGKWSHKS